MKKNIYLSIIYLITSTLLLIISYFTLFEQLINIKLNGDSFVKIEVYSKYKEQGATVYGINKKYNITGTVDTSKLACYTLNYETDTLITKKLKRHVIVVDTTSPEITLTGSDVVLYTYQNYQEQGFTAFDNYDKDLTNKVTIESNVNIYKPGEYQITYTVEDSSKNKASVNRKVTVKNNVNFTDGLTYINEILIVNKQYSLPSNYNPGVNPTAAAALQSLQQAASTAGYNIPLLSSFRSYTRQSTIYNNYVRIDGQAIADTYSARPGHSEHQSGLAFDVGKIDNNYGETAAGQWLAQNAHLFGFIIRYPQGKTHITGYQYEPWHIRYLGIEHATNIYNQNITLEEYLGVY